jgi:hypothetical protein
VTNVAFESFSCFNFGPDGRFLKADGRIRCGSSEHSDLIQLAWLSIAVYPIGLLVLYATLLFAARRHILARRETTLTSAITFLHAGYRPTATCFWWEIMEMLRRFLLVGLFVVMEQGSLTQLAIGTLTSLLFLVAQLISRPYRHASDEFLALASSVSLVIIFMTCSTCLPPSHAR